MQKLTVTLLALLILVLAGCGGAGEDFQSASKEFGETFCDEMIVEEKDNFIVVLDDAGRTVQVPKKPSSTVFLLNSFLDLWYAMGGKAVARVSGEERIPPEAEALPILGTLASVDLEQLIALEPDLVLLSSSKESHQNFLTVLENNDIPALALEVFGYHDTLRILDLFARINGRPDLFKEVALGMAEEIEGFISRIPEENNPSVVILFATSKSVTVETPYTSTGEMVSMLKARNIVDSSEEQMIFATNNRIPFSIENIVAADPDYILVSLMGDEEKARQALEKEIQANPAWNNLTAIKEGRLVFLPKKWFVYKPGMEMLDALQYLAEILYPEVVIK